jgi:hypothetical protein
LENTLKYEDLEIKTLVLSSKNYIELETKDFVKNYHNIISTYQNDLGYFNQAVEILKGKSDTRVYVTYNDITINKSKENGENKIILQKILQPIPVYFDKRTRAGPKLQRAFNLIKSFALQRIYRNNYSRHCIDKIVIDGEEYKDRETTGETKINLCVIMLEHKKDLNENKMNANFYKILIDNFKRKLTPDTKKKKTAEEYDININYGLISMETNKKIQNLFMDYSGKTHLSLDTEKYKLFLIIDDTHEKFAFKTFKDDLSLVDYFSDLHNSDFYEDISFSVN